MKQEIISFRRQLDFQDNKSTKNRYTAECQAIMQREVKFQLLQQLSRFEHKRQESKIR